MVVHSRLSRNVVSPQSTAVSPAHLFEQGFRLRPDSEPTIRTQDHFFDGTSFQKPEIWSTKTSRHIHTNPHQNRTAHNACAYSPNAHTHRFRNCPHRVRATLMSANMCGCHVVKHLACCFVWARHTRLNADVISTYSLRSSTNNADPGTPFLDTRHRAVQLNNPTAAHVFAQTSSVRNPI